MSSSQDNTTSNNLTEENTWRPKNLVKSRWAPGGFEDRLASTDGSAFGAQAFIAACKRARADPADIIQTGIDEMERAHEANKKASKEAKKQAKKKAKKKANNRNKKKNSGTVLTK